MAKANKDIHKLKKIVDFFIIVLDGRIPITSYNVEFEKMIHNIPHIFVIAKSDMADKEKKQKIIKHFHSIKNTDVIWANLKTPFARTQIIKKINEIFIILNKKNKTYGIHRKYLRGVVLGVPNSGKSTLINNLAKRKAAKTANLPGVTRQIQWISAGNIQLLDTPGILWPKFSSEMVGIKLAMIGAINLRTTNNIDFAYECLKLVYIYYPEKLPKIREKFTINDNQEAHNYLKKLAYKRQWLLKKGELNLSRTSKYVIDFTKKLVGVTYD